MLVARFLNADTNTIISFYSRPNAEMHASLHASRLVTAFMGIHRHPTASATISKVIIQTNFAEDYLWPQP